MKSDTRSNRIMVLLGINPSRIRPIRFLRFCKECREEDVRKVGEAYWHRTHQLPGIMTCYRHKAWLVESDVSVSDLWGGRRFATLEDDTPGVSLGQENDPG